MFVRIGPVFIAWLVGGVVRLITEHDIEEAHKRCQKPQLPRGSDEYYILQMNALVVYGVHCIRPGCNAIATDFHHIIPRREGKTWGGADCVSNIIPMCRKCHISNPFRKREILEWEDQFKVFLERIENGRSG